MDTNLQPKNRNVFIDLLKALAIICVVFGHCIQYSSGIDYYSKWCFFDNIVFKTIYSFHMPLFALISGYLFFHSINNAKPWNKIITQKFKSLVIPIISWNLIFFFFSNIPVIKANNTPIYKIIFDFIYSTITSLWFIWAIFFFSIFMIICQKVFKNRIIAIGIVLVLSFFTPDFVFNLMLYKFLFPFFIIGFYFNKNLDNNKKSFILNNNTLLFVLCISFIIMLFLYNKNSFIYTSGYRIYKYSFSFQQLLTDIFRFAIGLVGSLFFIILLKKIYHFLPSKIIKLLSYIGRNTIGIYIITSFINQFLLKININGVNYVLVFIESILLIIICLLSIALIKKVKFLNKILLGGR